MPRRELPAWEAERKAGRVGYAWASAFRASDGTPLDLATLDAVRLLEALGCRVGPARSHGAGVKHRTTCPWAAEHSGGLDDDAAVLFMEPGRWPVWRCAHSGHVCLGLRDLLEGAGVIHAA